MQDKKITAMNLHYQHTLIGSGQDCNQKGYSTYAFQTQKSPIRFLVSPAKGSSMAGDVKDHGGDPSQLLPVRVDYR